MKDQIIKFLAYNGKISVVCCSTTNLVEEARKLHDLSPLSTAAMGRVLTITALIGSEMKNKTDKLTIQIKGNGPIGKIVAVSDNIPNVKACITNPHADLPLNEFGKLDVGGAVGNQGFINVIKDIGLKEPYIGISPLTSGEIAEDFANYFETSEQKQTAVALGVLVDKNGVRASGGYIISPMPDATDEEISKIEKSIFEAGAMSKMLDQNLTLKEIAQKLNNRKEEISIEVNNAVNDIINDIRKNGNQALINYCRKFDGYQIKDENDFVVSNQEKEEALKQVDQDYIRILDFLKFLTFF